MNQVTGPGDRAEAKEHSQMVVQAGFRIFEPSQARTELGLEVQPAYATLALGLVLFVYAMLGLFKFNMHVNAGNERWASPVVGGLTGFLAGATGVSSVPSAPYMNSLGMSKDELLQALGLVFTVGTFALAVGLYFKGRFELAAAWESTLCLIPTMAGVLAGQKCRTLISAETFKTVFFVGLLALGGYMIVRVVWL